MYKGVDLVLIVARSVICMHLDAVQVVHHMAARKHESIKKNIFLYLAACEVATW